MLAFQTADIYQVQAFRGHEKQYMRLASAWSVVFLIVISASFFAKAGVMFSRVWLGLYYVIGLAALIGSRRILFLLVRNWTREGRLTRRTVIVGGGEIGAKVIDELRRQKDSGIEIIGMFDDRGDDRGSAECAGYRKLGSVDELVDFGRRTRVDLVIFSLPITAENRILQMLKKLWVLPVDIRLAAHTNKLRFRPRSYSFIGNVPVIDVFDRPIADWDVVMKWLFDKIVGGLLLLLALPVMAVIALAIKLDSKGPVLFKQKRYGFNNDLIEVYKFRSMYVDQTDATAAKLVTKDDPRVTRVGRFIRKTSLDELPQLFNVVFKGNLSLVGPRPHAVHAKAASAPLRRGGRRLFRPPSRQARHHRLGADQRLARRDRHAGEDPAARRARPLLHRELVGAARSLHRGAHALRAAQDRERLLIAAAEMTLAAAAPAPRYVAAPDAPAAATFRERILLVTLFITVLASSVAFIEPSPHDLLMGVLLIACLIAGVQFERAARGAVPAAAGVECRRHDVAAQCAGRGKGDPVHRHLGLSGDRRADVWLPVRATTPCRGSSPCASPM